MKTVQVSADLLYKLLKYVQRKEVTVDGEWGYCRRIDQIINDGDMPEEYHGLIKAMDDAGLKLVDYNTISRGDKLHLIGDRIVTVDEVIEPEDEDDDRCGRYHIYVINSDDDRTEIYDLTDIEEVL